MPQIRRIRTLDPRATSPPLVAARVPHELVRMARRAGVTLEALTLP